MEGLGFGQRLFAILFQRRGEAAEAREKPGFPRFLYRMVNEF